jgi:mannosyltransferase
MLLKTRLISRESRGWWYAVAALTAVALLVRLRGLNSGLWLDEILSVLESLRTPFPQLLAEFRGDNKHPLYAVLAHSSSVLFGEHPWSLRLPAVLFGTATIPLVYLFGTRVASRWEAFGAAALLALSYHHVWFSQNARGYTMLVFWVLLGTLGLLRALREQKILPWVLYGLISGLGAYTHLTYVFAVIGQAVVVAMGILGIPRSEAKLRWKGAAAGYCIAALFTLLLYAPMLGPVLDYFLHRASNLRGISTPGWALIEGLRVLRLGFGIPGAVGAIALIGVAAVGIAGIVSYLRRQPRVGLLLLVPPLVTLAGAFTARGTMYPRFFFGFIGFALLFWMHGAFVIAAWLARRAGWSVLAGARLAAAAAAIIIGVSALSVPLAWRAPKQDFGGAMRFVESTASDAEVIATVDVTSLIYGPYYRRTWRVVRGAADLALLRSAHTVWLVYTFPRYLSKYDPAIAATLERECRSAQRFPGTVGDGDVIVCRLGRI